MSCCRFQVQDVEDIKYQLIDLSLPLKRLDWVWIVSIEFFIGCSVFLLLCLQNILMDNHFDVLQYIKK